MERRTDMKRLLAILLLCSMVLTLLPGVGFAEGECSCESACTAEVKDPDCPVCSAEGATPEACGKSVPAEQNAGDGEGNPVTTYTVRYDSGPYGQNHSTNTEDTKQTGVPLTLRGELFQHKDCTHYQIGWCTSPEGDRVDYACSGEYTADESVTLYPAWKAYASISIPYSIVIEQGGEVAPEGLTFFLNYFSSGGGNGVYFDPGTVTTAGKGTYSGTLILRGEPGTLSHCLQAGLFLSFSSSSSDEGWSFSDAAYYIKGAPAADSTDDNPRYDWTLYRASFIDYDYTATDEIASVMTFVNTYTKNYTESTVTYLPGADGSGSIPADTKTPHVPLILSGQAFTREGYRQTGWATEENGPLAYSMYGTYTDEADITLYPYWERVYTVSIPLSLQVKLGGELEPGETEFSFQFRGQNDGVLACPVYFSGGSLTTKGSGSYPGALVAQESENNFAQISDGFYLRQRIGDDPRWEYDDTVYYIRVYPKAVAYAAAAQEADYIYEIHPAVWSGDSYIPLDETVDAITFVNTYTENAKRYTVTVTDDGGGTGAASPSSAKAGETVKLTATAKSGYVFKKWEIVSGDITIRDGSFTMPEGDVTVKAIFAKSGKLDNVPKTGDDTLSPVLPLLLSAALAGAAWYRKKKQEE